MTAKEWTFMVYLAGDNNLSAAGDEDLREMREVGSSDQVNIVAQFDSAGDRGTRRFHIQRQGVGETIVTLDEMDSGDPAALQEFIEWATAEYPARRYALILWNHGSGWRPEELDRIARSVDSPDYSERELTMRSGSPLAGTLFRTTFETIFKHSATERAILSDDGSGHSLDMLELSSVLEAATEGLDQKIDLLGMDACLMSTLEVAYQVAPQVAYVVGSEELEPGDGWPYDRILKRLVEEPTMSAPDLAAVIVEEYVASYGPSPHRSITQAAVDASRLATLTGPLDALAERLTQTMADSAPSIWRAQRRSKSFLDRTLWDIGHFCEELEAITSDAEVRAAAEAVGDALDAGPDGAVIAEGHSGTEVARCRGVSIYLPSMTSISPYYADLRYAKSHKWRDMLTAYDAAE